MPLHEDSSIVPDSTASSSRPTTPVVKRAPRVYGRKPIQVASVGDDSEIFQSAKSSSSSSSIYRTGYSEGDRPIPPSSDPPPEVSFSNDFDDDEEENSGCDASSTFQFAWKKKLKDIDLDEDYDADITGVTEEENASNQQLGHGVASPSQRIDSQERPLLPTSPAESAQDALIRNVFEGSLSTLPASSPHPVIRATSPQPTNRARRTTAVVHDSDSEEDVQKESLSASPANPHPITTPKLHSSPTPPTSEDDFPAISKPKPGKGKTSIRPDVVPLRFSEDPMPTNSSKAQKPSKETERKRKKIKAPTKKELKETARSRLRMAADQDISIPRAEVSTSQYTIATLFQRIASNTAQAEADPISEFSSERHTSPVTPYAVPSPSIRQHHGSPLQQQSIKRSPLKIMRSLPEIGDDSEEDLPDVATIVKSETGDKERAMRQQELLEAKKRLIEMQGPLLSDDNDDELQIVQAPDMQMAIKEEEAERRSGRKKLISEGRKRQLNLGRVGLTKQKAKEHPQILGDIDLLRRAGTQLAKKGDPQITQTMLNQIMMSKAEAKRGEVIRAKEEEWVQRGGKLKNQDNAVTSSAQEVTKVYAEKGRHLSSQKATEEGVEEEDEDSDDDWSPDLSTQLRGSASPSPEDDGEGGNGDVTMVDDNTPEEEEDIENAMPLKPRRVVFKAILDSDDEDTTSTKRGKLALRDLHDEQLADNLQVFAHPSAPSPLEDRTEDEDDKENETSRMWDRGEDKENKAVVRHLSQIVDDDPFSSPSRPSQMPTSFEARLKMASPVATPPLTAPLSLAPFIGAQSLEFSQSDSDQQSPALAAPLQASFSDLFDSGTEKRKGAAPLQRNLGSLGGSFVDEIPRHNNLNRADTLDLTQDVALQPAFEVSGSFLRKADQIFEKEQEYVLETANKKPQKEPELYVNDHGFLTQTRPDVSTPEVYRHPSPSQARPFGPSGSQSTLRRPLRTLSLSDEVDFTSPAPLGRLHKRATTPTSPLQEVGNKTSPSPAMKRPINAFDLLKTGVQMQNSKRKPLEKSEFVEQEAEESDDEEPFGFGPATKKDDNEDDGEDQDRMLEGLVDDTDMNAETVAAELVREKYQEHEQKDDEELEKLHQAAVQGELRKKRRNRGLGMDDSDDDSEDDYHNRRIRQGMYKKQKIERDDIKRNIAGQHEETKSFFNVYAQNLTVDDADFAYLQESQPPDVLMQNVEEEAEEEEDEPREVVTTAEVHKLLREAARQPRDEEQDVMDPNDVSWVDDNESDEDELHIKALAPNVKKQATTRQGAGSQIEFDAGFEPLSIPKGGVAQSNINRMQTWAKVEGRSHYNETTGRNVGGAAVTGHKTKSGGGSLRKAPKEPPTSASASKASERRPVTAQPSFLAKVAADSQSNRFA
ncbi:hypothetical protein H0H92_006988 [Tricholoma furcatifolium]|nr:hypothetical protein H0H92_006988 [Tricholoma furcatifolium]